MKKNNIKNVQDGSKKTSRNQEIKVPSSTQSSTSSTNK